MNNDVKEKLKALTQAYAAQLPAKIAEIESRWHAVEKDNDQGILAILIRNLHTLCGTAGTYGFTLVSDISRQLEQVFHAAQSYPLSEKDKKNIEKWMSELKEAVKQNTPQAGIASTWETQDNEKTKTIYVLVPNPQDYKQIAEYNYVVKIYEDTQDFLKAVHFSPPNMAIIDVDLVKSISLEDTKKMRENLVLLIYTSARDDLSARLIAIRHHGQAFLVRPFEATALLRVIDDLFEAKKMQNARILIVDDSDFLAEYYAMILRETGLICEKVTDPQYFLSTLQEFQPDLILMDINMPFCSGSELAQIVNQQENLSGIPIIFLSTISEKSKQLEVLSYAGDDFLTKPIDPKHLLATIRNRLMRSRMIRSRLMRDSLTGLYNHTMIHHQLERELLMASRYHKEIHVVLLDIDHFKSVNDTYGHQVGDKILKEFSLFLQMRLRKSDFIGRYGGEEFLIILPNITSEAALTIMNGLREEFFKRPHAVGDKQLFVTISGGIASYPQYETVKDLIRKADDALYQAKHEGRNRIVHLH